jgi:hypothetical protein
MFLFNFPPQLVTLWRVPLHWERHLIRPSGVRTMNPSIGCHRVLIKQEHAGMLRFGLRSHAFASPHVQAIDFHSRRGCRDNLVLIIRPFDLQQYSHFTC